MRRKKNEEEKRLIVLRKDHLHKQNHTAFYLTTTCLEIIMKNSEFKLRISEFKSKCLRQRQGTRQIMEKLLRIVGA